MAARAGLPELGAAALDGFEVWDRTVQAPAGKGKNVAFVSVRVGGVIGMNRAAHEMLGYVEAVKVMYDPKRHRLGIMPTVGEDKCGYDVRYTSSPQISCRKLFDYYGVEITETRRYHDLEMVDGVLVVNLGGESEKAPRVGRRSAWS